jgi:hypothetical protein
LTERPIPSRTFAEFSPSPEQGAEPAILPQRDHFLSEALAETDSLEQAHDLVVDVDRTRQAIDSLKRSKAATLWPARRSIAARAWPTGPYPTIATSTSAFATSGGRWLHGDRSSEDLIQSAR